MRALIYFSIIFASFCAAAANSVKWNTEEFYKFKTPDGEGSNITIERQLMIGDSSVPTMTLSFSVYPTGKFKSEKEVAAEVGKALGFSDWKMVQDNDFSIFEKYMMDKNRYVRLILKSEKKRVLISVASVRTVFLFPSLPEAEIIQREWFAKETKKTTAMRSFLQNLAMPEAYAQTINISPQGQAALDGIQSGIIGIKADVADGKVALQKGADGLVTAGNALDRMATNTSPVGAARTAFAAGIAGSIGMGIGGFVANNAISAVRYLYDSIMGRLTTEEAERFNNLTKKSIDSLAKKDDELNELEGRIDMELEALSRALDTNPETTLANMKTQIDKVEAERAAILRSLARASDVGAMRACREKLESLDATVALLRKYAPKSPEVVCSSFKQSLNKYLLAQNAILIAKRNVQNHMRLIISNSLNATNESLGVVVSNRTMQKTCEASVDGLEKTNSNLGNTSQDTRVYLQNMRDDCKEIEKTQNHLDAVKAMNLSVKMAANDLAVAKDLYKTFIADDCKTDMQSEYCDGRPGFLDARQQYYDGKVKEYEAKCVAIAGPLPKPDMRAPAERQEAAAKAAVARETAPVVGNAESSGGNIFSRFFGAIGNFFSSFKNKLMSMKDAEQPSPF